MSHFRTLTVVVQIDDNSDLGYPGYAGEIARKALESAGFGNALVRNAPNLTGKMPRSDDHFSAAAHADCYPTCPHHVPEPPSAGAR